MKTLLPFLVIGSMLQAQTIPVNNTAKILNKNKVKASIYTVNNRFWNIFGNQKAAYEVPVGKGTHAQFGNSIWIGGLDAGGQLHIAANTYRQNGADYWPGPLDTTNISAYTPSQTATYNKLWKVDCSEINDFVNAFSNGWIANSTYTVPPDILTYPAKGFGNLQRNMEPYVDMNGNGSYNPAAEGDYPIIKGHQQILSIYNDALNPHGETQGASMGLEIHERSYAYSDPNIHDTMQAINYTTFYHYTIYNRSSYNYFNVFLTDWNDVDLGNWQDDFVGTDSLNQFIYCYNASATDPTIPGAPPSGAGLKGYGNKPPVISHAMMPTNSQSDGIDNNNDGRTDEPNEQFEFNRTTYYNNNVGTFPVATTNPGTAIEYYNYMSGYWKDNTSFTYGGTGYGGTGSHKLVYTGNPGTNTGWTEGTAGNVGGDRRILGSSGPFNLPAGAKIEWSYAVVFSQDTTQAVNTITQFDSRVRRDVRNVRYYEKNHQNPQCTPALTTGIAHLKAPALDAMVYPNPATDHLTIQLLVKGTAQIRLFDLTGRLVRQTTINGSDRTQLDLSGVEPGAYVLEIVDSNNKLCKKVIKD